MDIYEEVKHFYDSYDGKKRVIGTSVAGRELFAMLIGSENGAVGISQYAIHGREFVTARLALEHIRRGVAHGGVWVVPLVNPDGALLAEVGISSVPEPFKEQVQKIGNFPLWKANLNGVDLNVNFPARWGTGSQNIRTRSFANYIGPRPLSEPESSALAAFTKEVGAAYTLSWHTKGEQIYWEFFQPMLRRRRDKKFATVLGESTGYPLVTVKNSAGGYKDWCIQELKIPAVTVEVGAESLTHPIPVSKLSALLPATLDALYDITNVYGELPFL